MPALLLDEAFSVLDGESDAAPAALADPSSLAYMIYTSGSTGRPKGAMNAHSGIVNRLLWMQERYGLTAEDRVMQKTPASFDVSVWELFWPLLTGARLVMAKPGGHQDTAYLVELIRSAGITTMHFVPSMLQVFLEQRGVEECGSLRRVICSGEALPYDLQQRFFAKLSCGLHNLYGPTEAAVDVTSWACEPGEKVPIGRPIANVQIHILDRGFRNISSGVPIGVPGELCIGGVGVGRGYFGRPELTAEKFVPDPLSAGSRLYRTGDLARVLADGRIEYLGRIDHQVKIRGFRIELGEIEAALCALEEVREAVVIVREEAGDRRLVAYVTGTEETSELRERLRSSLPEYMVPSAIVALESMPLNPSGKADRGVLARRSLDWTGSVEREFVAPRTALEIELAGLFQTALGVETGVRDSFFELGGNSITGAILINRLQQRIGEIVHVVAIFDAPTIEGLAGFLGKTYPKAVERLWGGESLPGGVSRQERREPIDIEKFRALLEPLAPVELAGKNPPAVFLLSPPRSGSTLLRVMLAGNPLLFAPPELELLGFNTMDERREAFTGRDSFWLEGVIRAVMEIRSCDPEEAKEWIASCERDGWTTQRFYREMQEQLGDRLLVDKTPSYALEMSVLERAEAAFDKPFYLHLIRHPYGMIHSFEEAKLEQVFFRRPHSYERRELAELVWLASQQNITEFLGRIPAERRIAVHFEELVREPERVLRGICDTLGLPYHPDMAQPYRETRQRMTDGVYAASRMLGDVKFHQHRGVDAGAAERWRETYREDFLGDLTWAMAAAFGYGPQPASPTLQAAGWDGATPLPLSFAQERLWFLDQLEPGSPFYNIPAAVRLSGPIDAAALERAFQEIARRHRILRTAYTLAGGQPFQTADPRLGLPLRRIDLSALPAEPREAEARRLAETEARRPFDLQRGPVFRTTLLCLSMEEHALLLTLHHIAADGWSMGILMRELAELYGALLEGRPSPLPELPVQYSDYTLWQRGRLSGEILGQELSWWRERLAGAPALLELPTDRPRPAVQTFRGGRVRMALPPALFEGLEALGRRQGATPFMSVLAAFDALLARYTGQEDLVVGSPVAGRPLAELEGLIGFFVNTLVLRTDLSGDPGFAEILERVRQAATAAYAHQDLPFEKLVAELTPARTLAHAPLFQILLALQNAPAESPRLGAAQASPFATEAATAKFDLTLTLSARGGRLAGSWLYNADLFDPATIARMAGHFERLVAAAVARPEAPLGSLTLLSEAERAQLMEWNETAAPFPGYSIHRLFQEQAARTPHALAVAHGGRRLTYRELDERSSRLALRLRALGLPPEGRVALLLERSPELVVAALGVLKAGGAYLPLDPAYPAERLRFVLEDSGAAAVLTSPDLRLEEDEAGPLGSVPECADEPAPACLAYVIYTSGSTGRPKGVELTHAGLANLVAWHLRSCAVTPADRASLLAGTGFDASIWEIWPYLLAGASLHVTPDELRASPSRLLGWLAAERITLSFLPTPLAEACLAEDALPAGLALRVVLTGGDRLHRAPRPGLPFRLVNHYGPTESTVVATAGAVEPGSGRTPPIGRPIGNTRVHLLDRGLRAVPAGVPGELCLGGAGLARGYLGRPDLTAERFVPSPFGEPGERLYRTGDLARFLPDGSLDFLGRVDHQVKLRGFRIELGEIEAALLRHPQVREAAVLVQGEGAERRLVAYLGTERAEGELKAADLRSFLLRDLPEPMVPAAFLVLAELPLTANGKVDRRALAEIQPAAPAAEAGEETRTPIEEMVAEIWREVLRLDTIRAEDDFFELGGHSLLATQVVARARDAFGVDLALRSLFETPTLSGWAGQAERALRAARGVQIPPLAPLPPILRVGDLRLSFAQERLWFLDQLEPASPFYNLTVARRLLGVLEPAALARAFQEIVRRHEVLRTTFAVIDGEPVQVVAPELRLRLPRIDLSALPEREAELKRLGDAESRRPFDLARGPLLRTTLVRLAEGEHALLLVMHHITSDGWSMGVLWRELSALYDAFREGRASPLPGLPVQYADFAAWQRGWLSGDTLEREAGWWKERMAGAPALLELPTDRPRPAVQSFRGETLKVWLPPHLGEALGAFARRRGATLFMGILAAFDALLHRYTGQPDLVVGSPVAGRNWREVEPLIGLFINTLVLRADLSGDPSFAALLSRVTRSTVDVYTHQELPFEKLVAELSTARTLAHAPVFQVMLILQNAPRGEGRLGDLVLRGQDVDPGTSKFDLRLALSEWQRGLGGSLVYNRDLFDGSTIARFWVHFGELLSGVLADPERRLSELALVPASERQQVLAEWNDTHCEYRKDACLHELIAEQAARTPEAVAVVFEDRGLTYGELDRLSNQLANRLRGLSVGPEVRVAVALERSLELIVGLVGVLKAGGGYVPLDPAYPKDRLEYMLEDSRAAVLLAQERVLESLPPASVPVLLLDETFAVLDGESDEAPAGLAGPSNLAYMIYTSGSTGRPKGAMNAHSGIVNRLLWMQEQYGLTAEDRVLQKTPASFDVSVWEALLAAAGGRSPGDGEAGRSPGHGLSGGADPVRGDHDDALRALDAAGVPGAAGGGGVPEPAAGDLLGRGAALRPAAAVLREALVRPAQPVRPDRGGGRRHALGLRAG